MARLESESLSVWPIEPIKVQTRQTRGFSQRMWGRGIVCYRDHYWPLNGHR